jgi:hypothetical protein
MTASYTFVDQNGGLPFIQISYSSWRLFIESIKEANNTEKKICISHKISKFAPKLNGYHLKD